jgi:hypothetical protein
MVMLSFSPAIGFDAVDAAPTAPLATVLACTGPPPVFGADLNGIQDPFACAPDVGVGLITLDAAWCDGGDDDAAPWAVFEGRGGFGTGLLGGECALCCGTWCAACCCFCAFMRCSHTLNLAMACAIRVSMRWPSAAVELWPLRLLGGGGGSIVSVSALEGIGESGLGGLGEIEEDGEMEGGRETKIELESGRWAGTGREGERKRERKRKMKRMRKRDRMNSVPFCILIPSPVCTAHLAVLRSLMLAT